MGIFVGRVTNSKTFSNALTGMIFVGDRYNGFSQYHVMYGAVTKVAGNMNWNLSMNDYYLTIGQTCDFIFLYTRKA